MVKNDFTFKATKYGGNSPKAVPKPHKKLSICTASKIPKNEIVYVESK